MGSKFIETGKYRRVLCIGAETLSRITDFTDRGTCILLADAAGAAVLEASDGERDHRRRPLLGRRSTGSCSTCPAAARAIPATKATVEARMHYAKMKGNELFKVAVRMFVECAEHDPRAARLQGVNDVDLFIPHQANLRIIEAAVKRVGLPMDEVFVNVDRYGNTGAASVYVALEEALAAGRIKRGDLMLLAAFGGGFAWGAALVRW